MYGADRGKPVDRWYIERFLAAHTADVRGRVLEVAETTYTEWYGGDDVTSSDVLHAAPGNPDATIVGDLATGEGLPSEAFDCFIMTQTLHVIYDIEAAVRGTRDLLAPGGVSAGDGAGHQPDQPRRPPRLGRLVALHDGFRPAPVRRHLRGRERRGGGARQRPVGGLLPLRLRRRGAERGGARPS